jgi:hypothetical protein
MLCRFLCDPLVKLDNSRHGVESLRSRHSLNYSRNYQHFMEPESSLPCSQDPSTGPPTRTEINSNCTQ